MSGIRTVEVFAPAKVNLTLHVTGQRTDGYHLIDSLVAFADVGDSLLIQPGNTISLTIEGPEALGVPADTDNLIFKVAKLFESLSGASFLLTKNLPVSSGIGGGSADAAAAFRGLLLYLGNDEGAADLDLPTLEPMASHLLTLGADIPMCLMSAFARIKGIGEQVTPVNSLPLLDAVLVNPRRAVSTPAVFKALNRRDNAGMPDTRVSFDDVEAFVAWLAEQRNDMETAAIHLEPAIADVKAALVETPRCLLARMSGSGATCFGLYASAEDAKNAGSVIAAAHPTWWVTTTRLGTQTSRALPRLS